MAVLAHQALHHRRQIDPGERLDRAGQLAALVRRHDLIPEWNRLDAGNVGDLQCENAANSDIFIGLEHDLEMLLVERVDGRKILYGCDP